MLEAWQGPILPNIIGGESVNTNTRGGAKTTCPGHLGELRVSRFHLQALLILFALAGNEARAATHYVDANSATPTPPFTSWPTAATTIQDAIDAAAADDEIVVTNGVYSTGGRVVSGLLTNRVSVDKPLFVHSVNGPEFTSIQGYQAPATNGDSAVRCVYLTNGASLSGFTLTNGATRSIGVGLAQEQAGGGALCGSSSASISNCVLVGNASGRDGGGAYSGTLTRCTISGNSSILGGGVSQSTLINCVLRGNSGGNGGGAHVSILWSCLVVSNSASSGGGAYGGVLNTSTLVGNSALEGGGAYGFYSGKSGIACYLNNCIDYLNTPENYNTYYGFIFLNNCCTTPLPVNGTGNIAADPLFVNLAGGDFHLLPASPCINAGDNAFVTNLAPDLNANPRISGGIVDIGAYEFQNPRPALLIGLAGQDVTLSWPLWASNFILQQAVSPVASPPNWTAAGATTVAGESRITAHTTLGDTPRFFRLQLP
jgi:hypothetical protein